MQLFRQLTAVQTDIVVYYSHILGQMHISAYDLGVICDDGAVIVVVALALIYIIGHAGVEYRLYPVVDKLADVTVYELCGVADGIGGYRRLPAQIRVAR